MTLKAYLSSTLSDLEPERTAVSEVLGEDCAVKQSYGASEKELVRSCLDDVDACDFYIGIVGLRYGYVPKNELSNPKGLSITELEYDRAVASGKPRLLFIKNEDDILTRHADSHTKEHPIRRVRAFRKRCGAGDDQRPAVFSTIAELREAVLKAFNAFQAEHAAKSTRKNGARKSPAVREPSASVVREAYLAWLREECERVVLLGLDPRERQNVRLGQVYVPAITDARADPADDPERGQDPKKRESTLLRLSRGPTLLLHRLGEESVYVPGDPGAGKSTFSRWLALSVARGAVPDGGASLPEAFREILPESLRGRFPVLCPLRQWSGHPELLAGNGSWTRRQLEDSLAGWIGKVRPGDLTAAVFRAELEHGRCLVILDGVDEIPERSGPHSPRRNFMSGLADALPVWIKAGNRILLTSRPYGVRTDEFARLGVPEARLHELPAELQSAFAHRWFAAAEGERGRTKARGLIAHLEGRPDLHDLRGNPMLLTALCVKYDEGRRLPGDLYRLYEAVVTQVLYKRYDSEHERDLARLRLGAIALRMHTGPRDDPRLTPAAEVSFEEIDRALADLTQSDTATERGGIDAFTRRENLLSESGLLLPKEQRKAGFYHLSFQEFLAAVRLLQVDTPIGDLLTRHASTPAWRPTLRFLFCAIADQNRPERALREYAQLATALEAEALTNDPETALLLADCLEVGHARGWNLDRFHAPLRSACEHALHHVEPPARAHLWRVLGALGLDDRPGVGVRDGLPDIEWVDIVGGKFLYGENKRSKTIGSYRIARHPITHAQFQCFIDAGGFDDDQWWQWPEFRSAPASARWPFPNHPRENVSWFDAMAFCRWLTARLRAASAISPDEEIRLPTEHEWERAARGTDGRNYPWGDRYVSGHANINETWSHDRVGKFDVGQTTPVGMYPAGESPDRVLDLSGNVWEWCLDKFDKKDRGANVPRVLRGGSWDDDSDSARASYRRGRGSDWRSNGIGVRVVCVSPILSGR